MAMGLTNLSGADANAYTDYSSQEVQNASANKVKSAIAGTDSSSSDEELMASCKQFESYFLEQVFKEMEKSVDALKDKDSTDVANNNLVSYYKDQTIAGIASESTEKQGTGLAQMLYENMKRNYKI
ncbi:MAG: hypothetical protein KA965_05910 [Butyrivibrio sp.]|nr:hypothetical protein [Butyrivibrio sp.]